MEGKAPNTSSNAAAAPLKPRGQQEPFLSLKILVYPSQKRIWLLGQGGNATNQVLN